MSRTLLSNIRERKKNKYINDDVLSENRKIRPQVYTYFMSHVDMVVLDAFLTDFGRLHIILCIDIPND